MEDSLSVVSATYTPTTAIVLYDATLKSLFERSVRGVEVEAALRKVLTRSGRRHRDREDVSRNIQELPSCAVKVELRWCISWCLC